MVLYRSENPFRIATEVMAFRDRRMINDSMQIVLEIILALRHFEWIETGRNDFFDRMNWMSRISILLIIFQEGTAGILPAILCCGVGDRTDHSGG